MASLFNRMGFQFVLGWGRAATAGVARPLGRVLMSSTLLGLVAASASALPDAVVTSLVASPASPVAGDAVTLSATVRNSGTTATPTGVPVGSGVQVDGGYVGSFFVRNGSGQTIPLAVGQSFTGQFDSSWTATQGSHQVCAFVDDIDRFSESDETNNSRCITLVVAPPPQPDVLITGITMTPSQPIAGDAVTFQATIKNSGNAPTPAAVPVGSGLQVGGAHVGSFFVRDVQGQIMPLAVNQSFPGTSDSAWTAVEGTHQVCAFADDIDRFDESDESNNSYCLSVTVQPPPRPDLDITGLTAIPSQPTAGESVTFQGTVKNIGSAATPGGIAVTSTFKVNGSAVGDFTVVNGVGQPIPLAVQQSFAGTSSLDWTAVQGTHWVCLVADDGQLILESNTANNSQCMQLTVAPAPQPDLEVTSVTWQPSQPTVGQAVTVTATLRNSGGAATPSGVDVVTSVEVGGASLGTFAVRNGSGQAVPLAAGQSYSGQPGNPWTATAGTHSVCATADSGNLIAEANEDNTLCVTLQVAAADPCSKRLQPSDFGTVNGALTPYANTLAYATIHNPACTDVTLTFTPGDYVYALNQAHAGIDLRGTKPSGTNPQTQANVRVVFEAGEYNFNHELFFTGFSSAGNLIVEGAGRNNTTLNFCNDPAADCACADTDALLPGCQPAYTSWGMLHFRNNPRQVVVRNLSLEGTRYVDDGTYGWEFDAGISLCFDASTCTDIMVDKVGVSGARYSVLSKNGTGISILDSHLNESNIAYLPVSGTHDKVLLYNNQMTNLDKATGTKYGMFSNDGLENSAMVKNTITNVAERGIYPGSGTDGLWIHDNNITNAGTNGSGAGINLGKASINDVLVSGNDITNIGDGSAPNGLGSRPISNADEDQHVPTAFPVGATTIWPNAPWNGYGITVSGAGGPPNAGGDSSETGGYAAASTSGGAIGLVQNIINGASSHGIKIHPGASSVMVYDNEVIGSGLNGLSIVPGYAYHGEYGYLQKGGVSDIWVQDNILNYNGRSGLEILPRGTPLFAVPSDCEDPDGCRQAHEPYGLCAHVSPGTPCVDPYNGATCGSNCYQTQWQSYQVDMHANTVRGNGLANLMINGIREPASDVDVYYSISGMGAGTIDPNWSHNFHIYPTEHTGQEDLGSGCVQYPVVSSIDRSDNGAIGNYAALVNRVDGFTFRLFDEGIWSDVSLEANSRFVYQQVEFDVNAPTTCNPPEGPKDEKEKFGSW